MSYLNGQPANLDDLIADLKQFAIDYGGFTDTGSAYTASSYDYTSLTKGGVKFNFSYRDTAGTGAGEVLLNTSTAWAGSGLLTAQTGAAVKNARAYIGLTPIEYWMFTDGTSVHCVVEISGDCYAHISLGVLEKYGSYTGGEYVSANFWDGTQWNSSASSRTFDGYLASSATYAGHVRCTYSGLTIAEMGQNSEATRLWARNVWWGGGYNNDSEAEGNDGELWKHQPNNYNGRSVLIPVEMSISDIPNTASFNGWIPLGRVSNAAVINIANLNAGDTVNTDWMVFPLCMKNPTGALTLASGQVDTLNIGFAYKK